jgi:DNA-binding IscR family transcriptional regulator
VRGPRGGYELARDHKRITAEDILRAAGSAEEAGEPPLPASMLINDVVRPALAEAERSFSAALSRINVEDMTRRAEARK